MVVPPPTDEERDILDAIRRLRGGDHAPLPRVTPDELRTLMRRRCAIGATTLHKTLTTLRYITGQPWAPEGTRGRRPTTYPGPLVKVDGTRDELRTTWRAHADDLADKRVSGDVIRRHREAIERYCIALEVDFKPEVTAHEKRSRRAREMRSADIQLPSDFVDDLRAIINDARYHDDDLENEMYRHSVRLAVFTFPRMPSELCRMRLTDIRRHADGTGTITIHQKKLGFEEGDEIITVPHDRPLTRSTLTDPTRRSLDNYLTKIRPQLIERGARRFGHTFDHTSLWVGPRGMPVDPDEYRTTLSDGAKETWPGFYPYLLREVGIIIRALEIVQDTGHFDIHRLADETGHAKWDNLQRYVRKGKQLLRTFRPGPDLDQLLYEIRRI